MKKVICKNLDEDQKKFIEKELSKNIGDDGVSYRAYFEKTAGNDYQCNVFATHQGGPAYASFKRADLMSLCKKIESSLAGQRLSVGFNPVCKLHQTSNPYQLPRHEIRAENKQDQEKMKQKLLKINSSQKKICTLIIDDDVDSIIPVYNIFRKYGCKTLQAMNYLEASRRVQDSQADIIVLDWKLGKLTGGQLLEQCAKAISSNTSLRNKFLRKPVKVVTYSANKLLNLNFSKEIHQYFKYIGHWDKKNMYSDIEVKAMKMMMNQG